MGKKKLFRVGDRVTISSEEPLFDDKGKRIDGHSGTLKSRNGPKGRIKLSDQRIINNFPLAMLKAPKSFSKLSSDEMRRSEP